MPSWEWMKPGTEAEDLARRLAEAGLPVVGGFISRSDFWHAQAALDQHERTAERAKDDYPVKAANSAEMLVRLTGPLDTVTVIELLDSPGTFSEAEREVMQRGLFHHHQCAGTQPTRTRPGRPQLPGSLPRWVFGVGRRVRKSDSLCGQRMANCQRSCVPLQGLV